MINICSKCKLLKNRYILRATWWRYFLHVQFCKRVREEESSAVFRLLDSDSEVGMFMSNVVLLCSVGKRLSGTFCVWFCDRESRELVCVSEHVALVQAVCQLNFE